MARPTRNRAPRKKTSTDTLISRALIISSVILSNVVIAMESISGFEFQSPEIQSLQSDTFGNPAVLWVDQGFTLFTEEPNSCKSCHESNLSIAAANHPKYSNEQKKVLNLEQRINACRVGYQKKLPLEYESKELLSLTAYLVEIGRGQPVQISLDEDSVKTFKAGEHYYFERRGQLNIACNQCHDDNVGRKLRGDTLSQGQPVGYPAYRLVWQNLGSLHRRFRSCNIGVRAEPFEYGSPEYVALEFYLAWRAKGLIIEGPGVRR